MDHFVRRAIAVLAHNALGIALNAQGSPFFRNTGEAFVVARLASTINVAVDVGLNFGSWSLMLLKANPKAKILGFEAVKEFAESARKRLPDQVKVFNLALSDEPSMPLTLYRDQNGANTSPCSPDSGPERVKIALDSSTLDVEFERSGLTELDFIKIDCDGWDLSVLKGALATIRRHRPLVQVELGKFWWETNSHESSFWEIGENLEYQFFVIVPRGLMRVNGRSLLSSSKFSFNVLMVPEEKVPHVLSMYRAAKWGSRKTDA